MNFFNYTTSWIKGEIFEAVFIIIFGALTIVGGFLFWKLGSTPSAKALLFPLAVTGTILLTTGISMYVSNQKRLVEYEQNYTQDNTSFITSEKKRVEDFQYMYPLSKGIATVLFITAILFFWFSKSHTLHAWGIGLSLFGLASLVIDYFSKERADIYYKLIVEALK